MSANILPRSARSTPYGWMLIGVVALYLLLSAPTLAALGIPYDVMQGSFPAKIHPGTYLLVITCLVASRSVSFGLAGWRRTCAEQPLLLAYLACMLGCFAWAVARHGPAGLAFYIDSLIAPGFLGLLVASLPQESRSALLEVIMVLLTINAVISLIEYGLKAHLVPGVMGASDQDNGGFFRSAALLGHPLTNAKVTVAALPFATRLRWAWPWRMLVITLLALSLLSFGGRTSLLVGGGVYGVATCVALIRRLLAGRFTYLQLTGGSVGVALAGALMAFIVVSTGLGDRFFQNFAWDNSASVRFQIWHTLDHFSGLDLWLGLPIQGIDHLAEKVGLDMRFEAIENFWLYQLLLLGLVGFVPFVLGLVLLIVHLVRRAQPMLWLAVVVYFVVASGTNSLASKTISLLLLTVMVHACVNKKTQELRAGGAVSRTKRGV